MNPPTEQLIRDYLNRLSVAARDRLGFAERQSLLDRTRARIEAECGGINGASAVRVRKALADLGDPLVLVELEVNQPKGAALPGLTSGVYEERRQRLQAPGGERDKHLNTTSTAAERYEAPVAGNGHREMAAEEAHAMAVAKGNEIGEDLLVTGGPDGPRPGRGAGSIRSVLAGLAAVQRRRRRSDRTGQPSAQSAPPGGPRGRSGGRTGGPRGGSTSLRGESDGGPSGWPGAKPSLIPAPRRPVAPDVLAAPEPRGEPRPGPRPVEPQPVTARPEGAFARLVRGVVTVARNSTLEVLAIVLLGVGGAVYPPIWLVGALLALPSKKWDIRDKFLGVTLPFFLLIIGTVLIIVFGGEHASIPAYAYEAWLGAGRLSRVLALAGALYLAWSLRRGRRKPKQPPWNVPHRLG